MRTKTRRIRRANLAGVTGLLLIAGGAAAQDALPCSADRQVGSLGITGIRCERCRFFTNGDAHTATFWTEPTILSLDEDAPAARELEEGDVLVAIDGELITTSEGSRLFSALPPTRRVPVRVRRGGRLLDLDVPLERVCRADDPPELSGRGVPRPGLPVDPVPPTDASRAEPPSPPSAPDTILSPLRGSSALAGLASALRTGLSGLLPDGRLGFGIRCGSCTLSLRDDGRPGRLWDFEEPPEVKGIDAGGPADRAGLRAGDLLLRIDGLELTSEAGGARFSDIQPGQRVVWTVRRDGRELQIASTAESRTAEPDLPPAPPAAAPLRFSGSVGPALVEVRGAEVSVVEMRGGRELLIRTRGNEIRVRVPGRD